MRFQVRRQRNAHEMSLSHHSLTSLIVLTVTLCAGLSGCSRSHETVLTNPTEMRQPRSITSSITRDIPLAVSHSNREEQEASTHPTKTRELPAMTSPDIGALAPAFTLLNQDGRPVSLKNLRGSWVVLYFFPKSDAPDCACHATEFTALLTELRQMNAKILGVNRDTRENHRMLRKKYGLELDLLSDPQCHTMRAYEVYVDSQFGQIIVPGIIRTIFLIDPNGRIESYWPDIISMVCVERVKHRLMQLQRGGSETY